MEAAYLMMKAEADAMLERRTGITHTPLAPDSEVDELRAAALARAKALAAGQRPTPQAAAVGVG